MEKRDQKALFLMAAVLVACSAMVCLSGCAGQQQQVKVGDTIKLYYSISLVNGPVYQKTNNSGIEQVDRGSVNIKVLAEEGPLLGQKQRFPVKGEHERVCFKCGLVSIDSSFDLVFVKAYVEISS